MDVPHPVHISQFTQSDIISDTIHPKPIREDVVKLYLGKYWL